MYHEYSPLAYPILPPILSVLFVLYIFILYVPSYAGSGKEFSLHIDESYNSNIYLKAQDPKEDFITQISAGFLYPVYNTQSISSDLKWDLSLKRYAEEEEFNMLGQEVFFNTVFQKDHRASFGIQSMYDYDKAEDEELIEAGIDLKNSTKERYGLLGGYRYLLGKRSLLEFAVDYEEIDYKKAEYNNHDLTRINTIYGIELGPRNDVNISFQWTDYNYHGYQIDNYAFKTTMGYKLFPVTKLVITPGAVLSHYEHFTDRLWTVDVNMFHSAKRYSWNAGVSEDLTVSGLGNNFKKSRAFFNLSASFSHRLRGNLSSSYSKAKTISTIGYVKTIYFYILSVRLIYKLRRNIDFYLFFSYSSNDVNYTEGIRPQSACRNKSSLGLEIKWD